MEPQVHVLPDADAVAHVAAETVVQCSRAAVAERGRVLMALSGGETPLALYRLLAGSAYDSVVPWPSVHLLWGDERVVPPTDPRSNYRMAADSGLLDRPVGGITRIKGELSAEEAAAGYEAELKQETGEPAGGLRLDLLLLGIGSDGHTASLFPGKAALAERERLAVATIAPDGLARVTLTLPVLLAARRVIFLVSGAGKADIVRRVLTEEGPPSMSALPARRVLFGAGRVSLLLDRPAADQIRDQTG